jgi:hypothetical protein
MSEIYNLLIGILDVIYWSDFTEKQMDDLEIILLEEIGTGEINIANVICEYLEIEKRGNRKAIAYFLKAKYERYC